MNHAITYTPVKKVQDAAFTRAEDALAAEAPLEIRLQYGPAHHRQQQNVGVTMRTPGHDAELAAGFLLTEGIIPADGGAIAGMQANDGGEVITVLLHEQVKPALGATQRNFSAGAGCGVCGKETLQSVYAPVNLNRAQQPPPFAAALLLQLPGLLRQQQQVFADTGGLHAAALFNVDGQLLLAREDIGRHNAVDKLAGAALQAGLLPLYEYLLLSGRAGFELIQKAAMAGIKIIAAVGAPSSLAVEMAHNWDITLIGFLRGQRFNIYSGEERIII